MRMRPYLVFFLLPVLAYLTLLFVLAATVFHPSRLGWGGFGVAAAVGLLFGAGASSLFQRSRTNPSIPRMPVSGPGGLLVVADAHCDRTALCDAVRRRLGDRARDVFVLAPVLASPLHFLTDAEAAETEDARVRLDEALQGLARLGIRATGSIGGDDPLQAVGDVLVGFPAGEILLAVSDRAPGSWLERDLERRVRESYGLPVSSLPLTPAQDLRVGA